MRRNVNKHGLNALFPLPERYEMQPGLSIFMKAKSRFVWADMRLPNGQRIRESTGVMPDRYIGEKHVGKHGRGRPDLMMSMGAQVEAERRYRLYRERIGRGEPMHGAGRTVGDAIVGYLDQRQRQAAGDRRKLRNVRIQQGSAARNLCPFWNRVAVTIAAPNDMEAWREWRTNEWPSLQPESVSYRRSNALLTAKRPAHQRKAPSIETIKRERALIMSALNWASRQTPPWLAVVPQLPLGAPRKKKNETNRRPAFRPHEVAAMLARFKEWKQERRCGGHYERCLLSCYVRLLLASGLRPGGEPETLRWEQVQTIGYHSGETILLEHVVGKTGPRDVVCLPLAVEAISDLRELLAAYRRPTTAEASLWPNRCGEPTKDFGGSFGRLVESLGIDPPGATEAALYSLRHTYITEQRKAGVPIEDIAENCGTSVEMIERYYGQVKSRDLINRLIPL
jgi:integrase